MAPHSTDQPRSRATQALLKLNCQLGQSRRLPAGDNSQERPTTAAALEQAHSATELPLWPEQEDSAGWDSPRPAPHH